MNQIDKDLQGNPEIQKEYVLRYFMKRMHDNPESKATFVYNGRNITTNLRNFSKDILKQKISFEDKKDEVVSDQDLESKVMNAPEDSLAVFNSTDNNIAYLPGTPEISDRVYEKKLKPLANQYFNSKIPDIKSAVLDNSELAFALLAANYVPNLTATVICQTNQGPQLFQFSKVKEQNRFFSGKETLLMTHFYLDPNSKEQDVDGGKYAGISQTFYLENGKITQYSTNKVYISKKGVEFIAKEADDKFLNPHVYDAVNGA